MAFLQGRHFVVPQDVKSVAANVLRHRVALTYEALWWEAMDHLGVARPDATPHATQLPPLGT